MSERYFFKLQAGSIVERQSKTNRPLLSSTKVNTTVNNLSSLSETTEFSIGKHSPLPVIRIRIGDKFFNCLLDSGASATLCSIRAFKEIAPNFIQHSNINPTVKISTLTGNEIKIHSTADISLCIGNKSLTYKFLITHANFSYDYDFILGFDFMSSYKCQINFENRTISFRGDQIPILKFGIQKLNVIHIQPYAKLIRKLKIPPLQSAIVQIKTNQKIPIGTHVLLNPLPSRHDLELHNSLSTITKDGTIPLVINNLSSNTTLHLNKNTKIAQIDTHIDIARDTSIAEIRRRELKLSDFNFEGIPIEAKQKLEALILEYADIFSTSLKTIGKCTLEAPPIELTNSSPIQCRPFPVPYALREPLQKEIKQLSEAGIIKKSNSRYSFPLILVKKKTQGTFRLVIDYRRLNSITVSSNYKLPLITDILHSLRGANYYSTLDANSSFHQIKLRDEDKHLTAFSSPFGHFEYNYLSFGLKNSAQIYQETADTVLNGLQSENIAAYIDDIILPANTIDDSIRKLRLVFDRFRQYGLTLNPSKCQFLQPSIKYLGHIVDKNGLKPLPETLISISHFPIPNTVRKLKRFLGLANYYRSFVKNFSDIVLPLTNLTKKSSKFRWTEEAQIAFDTIKSKLLSDVMLKHPNFNDVFYLNTDASGEAIGAALLQKDDNGILRPINYFSYKLKPHEKKWPAIQLEAYAILLAVRHYKVYLYGRKFIILSDCKSLNYLIKLDSPASRLSRWLLELSNYDFEFQHIKGSTNFLGDLLSRDIAHTVNVVKADIPNLETIRSEQRADPSLKIIIDYLENNSQTCPDNTDDYFLENGILKHLSYRNKHSARSDYLEQIVIPKKLIPYVLEGSETVHFAFFKNYRTIREKFYWKNMYRDIKNFSNSCTKCIEKKGFNITKSPLMKFETPTHPMERLSLDVLGPLSMTEKGNKYILTVIDHFTKYSMLFALSDITAETISAKLLQVITIFGVPRAILTDLGRNFQSDLFAELAKKLNIRKLKTTPYHAQTNAAAERLNSSIKNSLTCLSEIVSDWDTYLDYYNFIYNNSYHDSTSEKPSFLMFNRDLNLPFHLLEMPPRHHYFPCENYVEENLSKLHYVYRNVYKNLEKVSEKQSRLRETIAKTKHFQIGQKIYLHTPATTKLTGRAFAKTFTGPYRVIEKHSDVNYTVILVNKPFAKPVKVHVDRMFSYVERRLDLQIPETSNPIGDASLLQIPSNSNHDNNPAPPKSQHDCAPFDSETETDDYIPPFTFSSRVNRRVSDNQRSRNPANPLPKVIVDKTPPSLDKNTEQTITPLRLRKDPNGQWNCDRSPRTTPSSADIAEANTQSLSNPTRPFSPFDTETEIDEYIPPHVSASRITNTENLISHHPTNPLSEVSFENTVDNTESLKSQNPIPDVLPESSTSNSPPMLDATTDQKPARLCKNQDGQWVRERKQPQNNSSSDNTRTNNNSLSNRLINWAIGSSDSQQNKNILDKISDALANKLDSVANIQAHPIRPQKTRFFYRRN